jgi:DNA-binding PadR family transcriptional regulator
MPGGSGATAGARLTFAALEFIICEDMARHLLTDFELMIVLAILRTGEEAYGVQIAREIETTGGRRVLLGAVYSALDRLERNGLVASAIGDPTPERGGRAKRFFRVTPRGVRAARQTRQALVALWRGLPQLEETLA